MCLIFLRTTVQRNNILLYIILLFAVSLYTIILYYVPMVIIRRSLASVIPAPAAVHTTCNYTK